MDIYQWLKRRYGKFDELAVAFGIALVAGCIAVSTLLVRAMVVPLVVSVLWGILFFIFWLPSVLFDRRSAGSWRSFKLSVLDVIVFMSVGVLFWFYPVPLGKLFIALLSGVIVHGGLSLLLGIVWATWKQLSARR